MKNQTVKLDENIRFCLIVKQGISGRIFATAIVCSHAAKMAKEVVHVRPFLRI